MFGEAGGQHPHEARQRHQVRLLTVDHFDQGCFEFRPVGEVLMVQFQRGNAGLARPFQTMHAGAVTDDGRHFDR